MSAWRGVSGIASLVVLTMWIAAPARGADSPIVRAHLEPQGVVVGEEQRLVVDVLVPTWLLGAPRLPELTIPGVVVTPSGESGVNLTETIDGTTWSGVSNEYSLYAQRPGRFETPADDVEITYAVDGEATTSTVPIPRQPFSARAAPGTSPDEHVLAASSLELSQEVEPTPDELRVGDSVRRTIRIEAGNTRAMLLPEFAAAPIDGISSYPDTPRLVDRPGQRGGAPVAERIESTSWILERAGRYELPAISVRWWNSAEQQLETARLPAVSFDVAANPSLAQGRGRPRSVSWVAGLAGLLGLIALSVVAAQRGWVARAGRWVAARLQRARESERSYFGAFVRATRGGDGTAVLVALLAWLDRRSSRDATATIDGFVAESDSPELGRQTSGLEASLFGRADSRASSATDSDWSAAELRRAAVVARARADEAADEDTTLGPLNP